jgi:RND superfamily putative drug exporter
MDRDFNDSMISHLPLVFGFVILSAFLLLLVTFRSIVVPIKAIILNLRSMGAAYGAMVLVFQHGWFNGLLGIPVTGPIEAWISLPRVRSGA